MTNHIPAFSLNSIRFKLIAGVICVLIPLIGFLIYDNIYAINVIHNQVAESNKNMLTLYMKQIDTNLDVVNNYLNSLVSFDSDVRSISLITDENIKILTKVSIINKFQKDIIAYRNIDALFFLDAADQDFLYTYNQGGSIEERSSISNYITNKLKNRNEMLDLTTQGWVPAKIGNRYYLLRIMQADDNFIGAWVNVHNLLIPLNLINLGQKGASLLTDGKGEPMASSNAIDSSKIDLNRDFSHYYLSGEKRQFLIVGKKSGKGDFNLVAAIPDEKILENLPYLKRLIVIITIGSILLLPLSIFLIRKIILIPINRIMSAMKKIRDGDIEVRIKNRPTSDEFLILNQTFNNMLDQIHDLRIGIYEEQLSKQKAELEHLQLQVNPHFFMNSLNIIYRMAQTQKYGLIQEMSLCLIQYFRFMFRNNLAFVPLKDELEHVRNYIRIQELRLPGGLTHEINAQEFLLNTPVPPLVIQNFVENTVKYAVTLDEPVHLSINIDLAALGTGPGMAITIRDNGDGFPEEVLSDLREGKRIIKDGSEHIGIWNVRRRLKLLYAEGTKIRFANENPSGALIEIILPLKPDVR